MSPRGSFEEFQGETAALEKNYEWLEAADTYEHALRLVETGDFFRRGEIQKRIALYFHRAAMQTENRDEFLERMRRAVQAYEEARGLYERSGDENAAWVLRCRAISKYLSHWIEPDPSKKLGLLADCHELEGGTLSSFWDSGNKLEYCRTYNELAQASELLFFREWDQQARRGVLEERLSWGGRSIEVLLELDDSYEAGRTHLAYFRDLLKFYWYIVPSFQLDDGMQSSVYQYVHKAFKFADEAGDDYTTGLLYSS